MRSRASPIAKAAWLPDYMANLEKAGIVFRDRQAIYSSAAKAIPKGSNSYCMVTGYLAVNDTIEQEAMPHSKPGKQRVFVRRRDRIVSAGYAARLLAGAAG